MPDKKKPLDENTINPDTIEINPKESTGDALDATKEPREAKEASEQQDASEQKELKTAIEHLDMDDSTSVIAGHVATTINGATQEEKIKKLLLVAHQKGVIWAVNVAKKMDDPYRLDMFHDALAKQVDYKKFTE